MNNIFDSINTIMRTLVLLLFATISFRGYSQPQPTLILPDYDQYEACMGLAFNPQKTLYYNLNSSGVLRFYDSKTKKLLHSIGTDSLQVTQAIFVEEKRVLISASSNSRKINSQNTFRVYLFDLETNEIIYVFKEINLKGDLNKSKNGEQLFTFKPFEYSLLDFNKSKSLISIRYGEKLEVWNLQTLERVKKIKNVRGNTKFSSDGDYIFFEDWEESNYYNLDDAHEKKYFNWKKNKFLHDACAVEIISDDNIVLIGNKSGELIIKDINNWETQKVIKFFEGRLRFIRFDKINNQIIISDQSGEIKFLNKKTFNVEDNIEIESNYYVKNVIKNKAKGKLFVFLEDYTWTSELIVYDLNEQEILKEVLMTSRIDENNFNQSGILLPGLHGTAFVEFDKLSQSISRHYFSWGFLSQNEQYLANCAYTSAIGSYKSSNRIDTFIWDVFTGEAVISDSLLLKGIPMGYDSKSQMFLYRVDDRQINGVCRLDISTGEKVFLTKVKDLPENRNQIEANINSNKNDFNFNFNRWLNLNRASVDTFFLEDKSHCLIFTLDSLKSETIRLVDKEANKILWQKNYNSEVSYNLCGNSEFILICESKESELHLIEIKSGQRVNLFEQSEKDLNVSLQFKYKLNFAGEWLVLQKSRKEFDDLYEFEFWNISQKKKIFEFTSLTDISSLSIVIDSKRNRFISDHSGQFNYYSLSDGMKLGAIDLDVERDFSGYNNNENTCWLTDDNKYLIVADGTSPNKVSVYDNATLKKLYTRIQSPDGNWIAFDKDLNYDGSEGALKEVYYVKSLQVLSEYVPKESKHVPGLIEKIMSH